MTCFIDVLLKKNTNQYYQNEDFNITINEALKIGRDISKFSTYLFLPGKEQR